MWKLNNFSLSTIHTIVLQNIYTYVSNSAHFTTFTLLLECGKFAKYYGIAIFSKILSKTKFHTNFSKKKMGKPYYFKAWKFYIKNPWASATKMSQQVMALITKLGELSFIPRAYVVEGGNLLWMLSSDLHICTYPHPHTCLYIFIYYICNTCICENIFLYLFIYLFGGESSMNKLHLVQRELVLDAEPIQTWSDNTSL